MSTGISPKDKLDSCVKTHLPQEVTPQDPDRAQPHGTSKDVRWSARNILTPKRLTYDANSKRGSKRKRRDEPHTDSDHKEIGYDIGLSKYELERLENIRQNQAFLSSLNFPQVAEMMKIKRPSQLGLKKEKVVKEVLPARKSLRLQNKEAESTDLLNVPLELKRAEEEVRILKGPVPMCPVNVEEGSSLPEGLLHLWKEEPVKSKGKIADLKIYKESLQKMRINEDRVVKVVKERIFSAAFHPCASSLLMAAGDKWGQVGIWNLDGSWGDNGVLLFEPHTRPITCMAFTRSQPSTLITTSYDGAARAGDIERAVFAEVYRSDEGLKGFDFLSHDCTSLLIGDTVGNVAIIDTRTPGITHESLHTLDPKTLRSVHVHPMQKQYFVVTDSRGVHIYDVRKLHKKSSKPVSELNGHSRSVSCAYFSPDSGKRVLTTCMDDRLRVYDTSQLLSSAPLMTTIRHNTQTGRWLSKLQATWDPKQEDCFVVGSLERPRRVKVFHESGQLAHVLDSQDFLTTVCSITAFHPSRRAILGGNSSGRLHVFT